jgi:branched-chain amino acid transport system permease protein
LALAELFGNAAYKIRWLTNGEEGLSGIIFPWNMSGLKFYYLVLVVFIICLVFTSWLIRSRFGLSLQGIRENEPRMVALGYNTWLIKYACYIIAGVLGGIGGSLAIYPIGIVSPEYFSLNTTALALLIVLIGGRGTIFGPIIGAVIVVLLTNYISKYFSLHLLILGMIMCAVVLWSPKGIIKSIPGLRQLP